MQGVILHAIFYAKYKMPMWQHAKCQNNALLDTKWKQYAKRYKHTQLLYKKIGNKDQISN